jgi:hypothetical protein
MPAMYKFCIGKIFQKYRGNPDKQRVYSSIPSEFLHIKNTFPMGKFFWHGGQNYADNL